MTRSIIGSAKIAVFRNKKIRRTTYKNEWWFSVINVIEALTGTERPRKYWNDLKTKLTKEGYSELSEKIGQLKLLSPDGKKYLTDCANTETLFRIIQTIPSPKAEPFKRWLARVGYERVQEIEDPELATKRTRALYKAKGYSDDWIEKRMRGIAIREELTGEWQKREVGGSKEYSILTAEISKATFGMTPSQYKNSKVCREKICATTWTTLNLSSVCSVKLQPHELQDLKMPKVFLKTKGPLTREEKSPETQEWPSRENPAKMYPHLVITLKSRKKLNWGGESGR